MATQWDPGQYLKFRGERTQPSRDLAAAVELQEVQSAVDIGCGPGNSTEVLRTRWPAAHVVGVDNSPEMIRRAMESFPQGDWRVADMERLGEIGAFDVVFSNAAIQWVSDHAALIPKLMALVAPGGALAVQIPANNESPLMRAIVAASNDARWSRRLEPARDAVTYREASFYYDVLVDGCRKLVLWETTYHHVLDDHRGLIEWSKGTAMRPFLAALSDDAERTAFEDDVLDLAVEHYPARKDGRVLYPFNRLFFIAYR
jgi:trans-aconitate 2-methyltransferase